MTCTVSNNAICPSSFIILILNPVTLLNFPLEQLTINRCWLTPHDSQVYSHFSQDLDKNCSMLHDQLIEAYLPIVMYQPDITQNHQIKYKLCEGVWWLYTAIRFTKLRKAQIAASIHRHIPRLRPCVPALLNRHAVIANEATRLTLLPVTLHISLRVVTSRFHFSDERTYACKHAL